MQPLVTVIVTAYRREEFLKKTLASILKQSYKNLEIIIVRDEKINDAHANSQLMMDPRVNVIEIEHSGRPAVPRNVGLKQAKGTYIAFCDDDDIWDKEKILKQIEAFESDKDALLCFTERNLIDENGFLLENNECLASEQFDGSFESFVENSALTFSSAVIRSDLIKNGISFEESMEYKASEDYIFFADILSQGRALLLNEKLVSYRVHSNGISRHQSSVIKKILYLNRVYKILFLFRAKKKINSAVMIKLMIMYSKRVLKQIVYVCLQKIGVIKNV